MELLLFDREDDNRPARVIPIDPVINRTYHYWHLFVPGVQAGQLYGFRAHGAFDPARGLRFDASKLLLDPYGRAVVVPKNYSRDAARMEGDNAATAMKSVVADPHSYDWEGDKPLKRPCSRTIIYEMHVRGGLEAWRRWIDTALDPPHEIVEWNAAPPVPARTYRAGARSVVVLGGGRGNERRQHRLNLIFSGIAMNLHETLISK